FADVAEKRLRRLPPVHVMQYRSKLCESGGQRRERFLDRGRSDDERRRQPQHLRTGREDEEPALPAGVHHRGDWAVERGAEKEAATSHLEHARQRREPGGELLAPSS